MKHGKYFGNSAAEVLAKFHNNTVIWNLNPTASRVGEFWDVAETLHDVECEKNLNDFCEKQWENIILQIMKFNWLTLQNSDGYQASPQKYCCQ